MTFPKHILSDEGILTSFSIAKKIDNKEFKKIKQKAKKIGMSDAEIMNKINDTVVSQTKKSVENNEIPGLIWGKNRGPKQKGNNTNSDKKAIELTYLASLLAKKISEKDLSKYDSCYLINAIVNILNLHDKDFDEFYDKFSSSQDNSEENEDDWKNEDDDEE